MQYSKFFILGMIPVASFGVWFLPSNSYSYNQSTIPDLMEIDDLILESDLENYNLLVNHKITPDQYIQLAEISSAQVKELIVRNSNDHISDAEKKNRFEFGESLRYHENYIRETITIANKINANLDYSKNNMQQYLNQREESIMYSHLYTPKP